MIQLNKVTFKYPYDEFNVLNDVSFTLENGLNTILCDIQSGKTTICKLILGNLKAMSGEVLVNGLNVGTSKNPSKDILYLPQNPTFFENRSVLYNLQYPLKVRKLLKQQGEKVLEIAEKFEFSDLLKEKVCKLSIEQRKTLAVARGLTVSRNVVLFDGFFDDNKTCDSFFETIGYFNGIIVNLTTNKNSAQGNTVLLDGGKCIFQGDAEKAKRIVENLTWLADRI